MAEFGENLRKAREDKGMTQQTLADKIYVTRQAVSRWEGGSRYPDLMTAKKLSIILDIFLDDLLRDDDMERLPQVNPVVEYPLTKRIQTAILTCCFVPALIWLIWYAAALIWGFFDGSMADKWDATETYIAANSVNTILFYGLMAVLFGCGTYMSIKDSLTPQMTGIIAGVFFGENIISRLIGMLLPNSFASRFSLPFYMAAFAIDTAALVIMLLYFSGRRLKSPMPVYAVSLFYIALALMSIVYDFVLGATGRVADEIMGLYTYSLLSHILTMFLTVSLLLLLSYMARELDIKRKVSAVKK